jgi:cardiolipin synthase
LNFEITAFSPNHAFVDEIEAMLSADFQHARRAMVEDFTGRPFLFRAACRAARLLAPIQ